MLDRVGPSARDTSTGGDVDERSLLDEHVDDAQRRHDVGGTPTCRAESLDRDAERKRLREEGEDLVPARPDVDDRPVRRVEENVPARVEARPDVRCEP